MITMNANKLFQMWQSLSEDDGNLFCAISLKSDLMVTEERLITENGSISTYLSFIISPFYHRLKKYLIQKCWLFPRYFHIFELLNGTVFMRFQQDSRSPGNHYDLDVPIGESKLSFSFYAFPIDKFIETFVEALAFVREYKNIHDYTPVGFAIYFVKLSGKRVAGPYAMRGSHCFSFNPLTDRPNDPKWKAFLIEFTKFAKKFGGRCALNQTLFLEEDLSFGAAALAMKPSSRFASSWLKQFVNDEEEGVSCLKVPEV